MKRNRLLKTGILFVFFVFVCSSINPVSAVRLDIAVSSDPDPATVNQILLVTVTRTSDGSPVEDALVQYILNGGTPTNTFTDASGISSFKPQLTGTLDIIVTKADEELPTRTVEVVEGLDIAVSSDPGPATVNQILSVTVTRASDGSPVEGALVQYILNDGTPINTFTDANGISSFKPQLTGTLDIIVTKADEGLSCTRTVDVVEAMEDGGKEDEDKKDTTTTTTPGGGEGAGGGARLALTQSPTPTSVTPTPLVTPTPPAVTPNPNPNPIPPASVPVIRLFIIVAIIAVVIGVAVAYTVLRRR